MKIFLLIIALVCFGCGDENPPQLDAKLVIDGPIETADGLGYINRTTNELVLLNAVKDSKRASLDIKRAALGSEPGVSAVSSDGKSIYVVDRKTEVLQIVDIDKPSAVEKVELSGDFDRITVDPFGEFLVLSFSGADGENVVARNLNEIGVVSLSGGDPVFTTLSTRANSFSFAPPFQLDGQDQRLMAVLADDELTVFDLLADTDEDRLREVPLSISESEAGRIPLQTVFDTSSDSKLDIYLRTQSEDISRITVRLANGGNRKLNLSTDQLTVPVPSAMELVTLANGTTRLVTASSTSPTVTVVDTISDLGTTFDLPLSAPAQKLIPFRTVVEEDGVKSEELRLLAYSSRSQLVAVIRPETVALEGDDPTLGRSVTAIRLEQAPTRIELATGSTDQAIVFHESSGFSLLNLFKNNDVPIQGGALRSVLFNRAFVYVVYRTLANLTIFTGDGHPTNFDLPYRGTSVHFFSETETLIVPHPDNNGSFTILDANDPKPSTASVYEGVFLQNIFDREYP